MEFSFATADRIVFGAGSFPLAWQHIKLSGQRIFIVTGSRQEHLSSFFRFLRDYNLDAVVFQVTGEPDTETIQAGLALGRNHRAEAVVAVGGGSVIDAGKAIAALIPNPGDLFDYLEVIGGAAPLVHPKIPLIAVPTTAGTGAEATSNAVILSRRHKLKVSLRHPSLFPDLAVVDPDLCRSLPKNLTAWTGVDAFTQLLESFVSNAARPFTDALAREGLSRVRDCLFAAYADGENPQAREGMCLASLASGMALANAKLGAVHGIAGPLGGMVDAPHGGLCAALLVSVMKANLAALAGHKESTDAFRKYKELAQILTGNNTAVPEDAVAWIEGLLKRLEIPGLSFWGVKENMFDELSKKARASSSMKGNPIALSEQEIISICRAALD